MSSVRLHYRIVDDMGSIYESNDEHDLKITYELIKNGSLKLRIFGELRFEEYELELTN